MQCLPALCAWQSLKTRTGCEHSHRGGVLKQGLELYVVLASRALQQECTSTRYGAIHHEMILHWSAQPRLQASLCALHMGRVAAWPSHHPLLELLVKAVMDAGRHTELAALGPHIEPLHEAHLGSIQPETCQYSILEFCQHLKVHSKRW